MPHPKTFSKGYVVFALIVMAVAVAFIYYRVGAHAAMREQSAMNTLEQTLSQTLKQTDLDPDTLVSVIEDLGEKLSYSPAVLGRLAELSLQVGWYDKAVDYFSKAQIKDPSNVHFQVQYVYANVLLDQGKMRSDVLEKALQLDKQYPEEYAIKNLLAMHFYLTGAYDKAVVYWEQLLTSDEHLSGDRQAIIENAIIKSKSQLSLETASR